MSFLIEKNLRCLRQVLRMLEQQDDAASLPFICSVARYYRSFLDGLTLYHIDYDHRGDPHEIRLSRVAALGLVRYLIEDFETSSELNYDGIVWVRLDGADASGIRDCFMESSVSRELQMLCDRTFQFLASRIGDVSRMRVQEVA